MIIFQNQGLIPIEAFTTFGINAKPNSNNPIGYFGTGLKYAVAVTLRLGGTFRLFRGIEEYEFYLKETDFRGKSFQTVRMRKRKSLMARWSYEKLPFTTELGKNWEPWMAIRELESNTRDENGHSCIFHEHDDPHPDYTMIIIECPEMEEAYQALDQIFMEDGMTKLCGNSIVEVYDRPSKFIYFRGLRVTDLGEHESLFTYNFVSNLSLTEDRTDGNPWMSSHYIAGLLTNTDDRKLHSRILGASEDSYEATLPLDMPLMTPGGAWMMSIDERHKKQRRVLPRAMTYYSKTHKGLPTETFDVTLTREQLEYITGNYGCLSDLRPDIMQVFTDALEDE